MTKAEIRNKMKAKRNSLTREEQLRQCNAICERLFCLEIWLKSRLLFTYLSFRSEADTWGIVHEALSGPVNQRKKVYVPRVEEKRLEFYEINKTSSLKPSRFGVMEPEKDLRTLYISPHHQAGKGTIEKPGTVMKADQPLRLMLMPGLAFDPAGSRIGYGAGYYDRYLTGHSNYGFIKAALAYDFQIMDNIFSEDHDVRMDYIITPTRLLTCGKAPVMPS